jgi:hypothetical protein
MAEDISFDDLIPKQQPTPASSKGADISFDDLIPKKEVVGSRWHNIGRTALETMPSASFGLAGFGAGMVAAAPVAATVAPFTGPFAPITAGVIEFAGGLGTAFVASGAAQKVTDMMHEAFAPEDYKQRQIEKSQRPYGTFAAQTLANLAGMSPKVAPEVAGKILTKPIVQRGISAGLTGTIEAGSEYATEGKIDPIKVAAAATAGAAMPGFNPAGKKLFEAGSAPVKKLVDKMVGGNRATNTVGRDPDLPEPPGPEATQTEKDAYVEHIKARRKRVMESQPLVETALRNKSDPNDIERMGPKHDEQRKADTKDTHEQGFMDAEGNFLTREEAYQRALKTGMLDKTHALEFPDEGLHSGDLRAAGHEAFQLTEEQKAGASKTEKPPVTREEHKTSITSIDKQIDKLSDELLIAETQNNEPVAKATHEKIKELKKQAAVLRQAMPAATFADKRVPTWEETHDFLWGIKNFGEALDALRTAGVGGKGQRILLETLSKFKLIRDATVSTQSDFIEYVDAKGQTQKNASGLYDNSIHHVNLGKNGDLQIVLHEAIHAGTSKAVQEGNLKAISALKKILNVYQKRHAAEYEFKLQEFHKNNPNATIKELTEFKKQEDIYALTNVHELLAEAFTDVDTIYWMKGTPSNSKKPLSKLNSLWNDFKNAIQETLGVKDEARTALDDVLELGVEVLQRSEGQYRKDGITGVDLWTAISNYPSVDPTKDSRTGESTTERLATEPVAVPEQADIKAIKTWEDLVAHGERVLFEHGEEAATKFFESFKEFQKTWGKQREGIDKLVSDNLQSKGADERLNVLSNKELEKAITTPEQNKITRQAIENGKVSFLPDNLRAAAERFKNDLKSYWERANAEGVIHGYIENYFPHMLDWVGGPENVGAKPPSPTAMKELINSLLSTKDDSGASNMFGMDTGTKRDLRRSLDTLEDLSGFVSRLNKRIQFAYKKRLEVYEKEKARLEDEGKYTGYLVEPEVPFKLKIKTDSIVEAHKIYTHAISKAIANKKFMEGIKDLRDEQGNALMIPIKDQKMPFGWKQIDSPQLANMAIHPDLVPSLQFLFDAGPGQYMKAVFNVSQAVKRFNVIGSFFHAKSLLEVLSSAKTPLWSPLYDGMVAPLIEQGARMFGKEIQLSAISKALEAYRKAEFGDSTDRWIREDGLVLEVPEDVKQGLLTNIGKVSDDLIGKFGPKTRVLEKSLSAVEKITLGAFDHYTWDYLHTGIKLHVAESYLAKQKETAAKSGQPFDEAKARKEIASFVNNAAGGLNWHKMATEAQTEFGRRMAMAAYSPQGRRALQSVLFAPDWTLSTLRSFTSALPDKMNPTQWHPVEGIRGMITPTTKADYARLYQFKTALLYFTVLNGFNMMTANRPIWENKDPTRIEWPDGTSMQAMKHAMEPYHWIMSPDQTFANKLGFIPKALWVAFAGTEYASPLAQKIVPKDITGISKVDDYLSRGKVIAKSMIPFQAQASINAPEGEGAKRAVLGTMGFPVYGSTPEEKKIIRAERELRSKENAWKYRDKEIESGRMEWTSKHAKDKKALEKQRKKLERDKARQE